MICVRLIGGLGNQMFQYACGRSLAEKHRTNLILDCSFLEDKTPRWNFVVRDYELDIYAINALHASKQELNRVKPSFWYRVDSCLRRLSGVPLKLNPDYLLEQQFSFNSAAFEKASSNCFLVGYWQSEKYFKSIESILRQEFTFQHPLDHNNAEIANRIGSVNSVSIHIRRGDYAKGPQGSRNHALCTLEYYQNAISYVVEKASNPVFFIFSDDIEWVKAHLDFSGNSEIVAGNSGKQSYIDMQLMSLCSHNIIANSSFSWWGAWLNNNSEKMVVAPKHWFTDEIKNALTKDLIPETWIRL